MRAMEPLYGTAGGLYRAPLGAPVWPTEGPTSPTQDPQFYGDLRSRGPRILRAEVWPGAWWPFQSHLYPSRPQAGPGLCSPEESRTGGPLSGLQPPTRSRPLATGSPPRSHPAPGRQALLCLKLRINHAATASALCAGSWQAKVEDGRVPGTWCRGRRGHSPRDSCFLPLDVSASPFGWALNYPHRGQLQIISFPCWNLP